MRTLTLSLVLLAAATATLCAQQPAAACGYERCALGIMPRLTSLDVVRGTNEARVASLPFLWPSNPVPSFAADSSAASHARNAVTWRRVGMVLTDVGGALALAGIIHRSGDSSPHNPALLAGATLIAISVPIHFSADAELSRAVWEFNRRFADR